MGTVSSPERSNLEQWCGAAFLVAGGLWLGTTLLVAGGAAGTETQIGSTTSLLIAIALVTTAVAVTGLYQAVADWTLPLAATGALLALAGLVVATVAAGWSLTAAALPAASPPPTVVLVVAAASVLLGILLFGVASQQRRPPARTAGWLLLAMVAVAVASGLATALPGVGLTAQHVAATTGAFTALTWGLGYHLGAGRASLDDGQQSPEDDDRQQPGSDESTADADGKWPMWWPPALSAADRGRRGTAADTEVDGRRRQLLRALAAGPIDGDQHIGGRRPGPEDIPVDVHVQFDYEPDDAGLEDAIADGPLAHLQPEDAERVRAVADEVGDWMAGNPERAAQVVLDPAAAREAAVTGDASWLTADQGPGVDVASVPAVRLASLQVEHDGGDGEGS
jgi:hypothetical protein